MLVVVTVVGLARVIESDDPFARMVVKTTLAFAVQAAASLAVTPVVAAVVPTFEREDIRILPEKPELDEIPETWRLPIVTPTAPTLRTMRVT